MSPRLWRFRDMHQMEAGLFVEIARISGYITGLATGNPSVETGPTPPHMVNFGETSPETIIKLYAEIEEDCKKLGLAASATSAGRIKELFKSPGAQYKAMREKY